MRADDKLFRLLTERAPDTIFRYRIAPRRGYEYVNPAVAAILGYTPGEHYTDPDLWFKLVHPDDRSLLEAMIEFPTSFVERPIRLRWRRRDGAVVWTETRLVATCEHASDVAIEGIMRDVTEQVRADEERAEILVRAQEACALAEKTSAVNTRLVMAALEAQRRLQTLHEATNTIGESLSIEHVLAAALDAVRQLLAADRAAICQVDEDGTWRCSASFGLSTGYVETLCRNVTAASIIGRAAAARTPVLVGNVAAVDFGKSIVQAIAGGGVRAVLALPLLRQYGCTGVVSIYHNQPHEYTAEEIQAAQALAGHLEAALDNARLYAAERRARVEAETAREEIAVLLQAAKHITSSLDLAFTVNGVLDHIVRLGEVEIAVVALPDAGGTTLQYQAARDPTMLQADPPRLGSAEGLTGIAAQSGEVINVLDMTDDERVASAYRPIVVALQLRSALFVPLRSPEGAVGVLSAYSQQPAYFTPGRERLLCGLADHAALAIVHARLYREAQQAVRVRNEVLATVTHDLKNPLASVHGYAQLLRRLLAEKGELEGRELAEGLAKIESAATKMSTQLNELLDVARLQTGKPLELRRRPTDLVALVRQVTSEYQKGTERHQIRVDTIPELVGHWDMARLERVLANLLSNAIKYSPDGGEIAVTVTQETSQNGTWAVVEARDRGLGIPAADLPHVFEQFHRAGNVVGQIAGTGLGLANARQIVEQHGGTITATSEEGKGSTLTVRLPLFTPCLPTVT